jgi:primosomal protein N' (replication factor Y)
VAAPAAATAHELHGLIRAAEAGAVLGPAPLFRLRGKARLQLLVKARERQAAITAVGSAVQRVAGAASKRKVSISVDVDPQ